MINTEEQQILNLKVKYEDAIYGIMRYRDNLTELEKVQKKLAEDLENGRINREEYNKTSLALPKPLLSYYIPHG